MELSAHSMLVFDKAYNYYYQFAKWSESQVFFVTRFKKNAVYSIVQTIRTHVREKGKAMVLGEEIIELEYHPEDQAGNRDTRVVKTMRFRKISYQDD